jgi:transcriptional regulator with XRE-family HTH domain
MATNIRSIIKRLPKKDQEAIEIRAQELIKEEMNLQELRKAQQLTQHQLAQKLGVKQAEVSRLENREDILLSSLNSWVEAMGGTLEIAAKIAGQKIRLAPFGHGLPTSALLPASKKSIAKASKSIKPKASAHRVKSNYK